MNILRESLHHFRATLVVIMLAVGLPGCDNKNNESGQVAARVNSDDISIHQLNFAASRAGQNQDQQDVVLERLIDRQLLLQQAQRQKLDRRPDIATRLEEVRMDMLAAAYIEELSARQDETGDETAAKYYAEHPGLFAQRRIYRLREVSMAANSPSIPEIEERLKRNESLDSVLAWLKQQQEQYGDQLVMRPPEQLPIVVADRLVDLKPGQATALRLGKTLTFYEIKSSDPAPLSWQSTAPSIRIFLKNEKTTAALKVELERLRADAIIRKTVAVKQ